MKDGIVQQIGDPRTMYNRPANVFVAGFIGSPSMNFLDGKLDAENGSLWLDLDAFRLQVPPQAKNLVSAGKHTFVAEIQEISGGASEKRALVEKEIELAFNMDKLHLFDPETENAILNP